MSRILTLLGGIALGASLAYTLDPVSGSRRRAVVRSKGRRALRRSRGFLGKAGRDLAHRAQGLTARVRHRFSHEEANDEVLVQRVRSKMGRYVSHPHAIEVTAHDGVVTLRGPVLGAEVPALIEAISAVPGVGEVENQLAAHRYRGNLPALQGGRRPPGEPREWQQEQWTPALQLATAAAVGLGLLYGTKWWRASEPSSGAAPTDAGARSEWW